MYVSLNLRSRGKGLNQKGFSLTEVSIVLGLAGVLYATATVPTSLTSQNNNLEAQYIRVKDYVQQVSNQARSRSFLTNVATTCSYVDPVTHTCYTFANGHIDDAVGPGPYGPKTYYLVWAQYWMGYSPQNALPLPTGFWVGDTDLVTGDTNFILEFSMSGQAFWHYYTTSTSSSGWTTYNYFYQNNPIRVTVNDPNGHSKSFTISGILGQFSDDQ